MNMLLNKLPYSYSIMLILGFYGKFMYLNKGASTNCVSPTLPTWIWAMNFLFSTVQAVARSKKKKLERKGGWCQTISIVSAPNPTANSPMNQEKLWRQALTHLHVCFRRCYFWLEIMEMIKIESYPCQSIIWPWFTWGWIYRIENFRIENWWISEMWFFFQIGEFVLSQWKSGPNDEVARWNSNVHAFQQKTTA